MQHTATKCPIESAYDRFTVLFEIFKPFTNDAKSLPEKNEASSELSQILVLQRLVQ